MGSHTLEESSREDWGNFSWTAEIKSVSVDGVEGVLEVERDTRTLLWPRSKVFWTSCTTFFCSAQDAHTELDRRKKTPGKLTF